MKRVLALIEKKKQEFAQLPLFQFMQDKSIDPRQRLAWAACYAPIGMGFTDLSKYVFRKEPPDSKIQEIINNHTYEDETHYVWFLEDLEKLGFNQSQKFSDFLKFIWSKETEKTRQVVFQIGLCGFQADPFMALAVIETIEATGNVIFTNTTQVAQELQQITKQTYRYFGQHHLNRETGHAMGTNDVEQLLESMQLTEEQKTKAFELVEKVFEVVSESMNELLTYAENHPVEPSVKAA